MKKFSTSIALLMAAIVSLPLYAGMLTGTIKDSDGKLLEGVLVRVTDDVSGVSESVYTSPQGKYQLATRLHGTLSVRARTPYYRDAKGTVELAAASKAEENLMMFAMTGDEEISDSLPAAIEN